jgi:hypothetical protein
MNLHRPADAVHLDRLIVTHREVAAEVVLRDACVDVVRAIDPDLAVEHVRRRIGRVDLGDERLGQELGRVDGLRRLGFGRLDDGRWRRRRLFFLAASGQKCG